MEAGSFWGSDILEVPSTVNVITREALEAQAAAGLYDAVRNTAGVTRQQNGGDTWDQIVIRGIGVENRSNYRLNGSLPIMNFSQVSLENKERVEVLKGASALYYGFTSPAGVVNFTTKRAGKTPVTALGLSVLMQSFHGVFVAIKYAGCAYLLYLAYKAWTAPAEAPKPSAAARDEGLRLFLGGIALTLGNPKVMVFFLSILPLVIDLNAMTTLAFVEVAALIAPIITGTLMAYAYAADRARRLVASPRAMRWINRTTGGVMAGAAAAIATRS